MYQIPDYKEENQMKHQVDSIQREGGREEMNGLVRLTYEAGGVVGHMSPCQLGKEKLGSNKNSHPTCFRPVSRQIYAIYPFQENKII